MEGVAYHNAGQDRIPPQERDKRVRDTPTSEVVPIEERRDGNTGYLQLQLRIVLPLADLSHRNWLRVEAMHFQCRNAVDRQVRFGTWNWSLLIAFIGTRYVHDVVNVRGPMVETITNTGIAVSLLLGEDRAKANVVLLLKGIFEFTTPRPK